MLGGVLKTVLASLVKKNFLGFWDFSFFLLFCDFLTGLYFSPETTGVLLDHLQVLPQVRIVLWDPLDLLKGLQVHRSDAARVSSFVVAWTSSSGAA